MSDLSEREAIIAAALQLDHWGLNQGRTGNLSVRSENGCLITPTGMAADQLNPDDIVELDTSGKPFPGQRVPSSEWHFHVDLYKARSDIGAIVHTHSSYATALACVHKSIPPFHYMIAETGGDHISVAEYATFGTRELSDHIITAIADRFACLMANHGQLACGKSLAKAVSLSRLVEELAKQYSLALQIGEPVLLTQDEMAVMMEKFKTYGKENETD